MPITQTRMLAVIKAADDFREKLLFTEKFIQQTISALPRNPSLDEALSAIHIIQQFLAQMSFNPQHLDTLATERAHFAANASRNARHSLRARIKRGQSDSYNPSRSTAPESMSHKISRTYDQHLKQKGATLHFTEASPQPEPAKAPTLLTDAQLAAFIDVKLANQKNEINNFYSVQGLSAPYADIYDDSTPLSADHKRHLKIPVDDEDDSPF